VGSRSALHCHPCHFTHSELFPHPSWIVLRSSTQCMETVRALKHVCIAIRHHLQTPKCGISHISGILNGLVMSYISLYGITFSPKTWIWACKRDLRRLGTVVHANSPTQNSFLNGLVLSSMPFHPLRTLTPAILDSTEVIHTV
jgi:hypothetical protein